MGSKKRNTFDSNSDSVERGGGGCVSSVSQLVLDSAKGELVKAPARVAGKKNTAATEAKALAALKNHSEAEKRRRQRINAHLTTLRGLVPSSATHKMDKATLLAEVITHMKELQKKAVETCQGLLLPMDADEVTVEPLLLPYCDDQDNNNNAALRVSLCFRYRHDVLLDLKKAINALHLRVVTAEMSTFQEWLKISFIFFTNNHESAGGINKDMKMVSSIHRAFSSVLEKNCCSVADDDDDFSPASTTLPRKRRRVSMFNSSSSSS